MKANTLHQQAPFIVRNGDQIDKKLSVFKQKVTVNDIFIGWVIELQMQIRTGLYDKLHHTNYRQIRNHLRQEQRDRQFESSIGLVRA